MLSTSISRAAAVAGLLFVPAAGEKAIGDAPDGTELATQTLTETDGQVTSWRIGA